MRRRGEHGAGTWSSPGGHLDYAEDPAACAVREAREELGVDVTHVKFLAVTSDVFDESGLHYITVWFTARTTFGTGWVESPREVMEVGWFDIDGLPSPLFEPLDNLLAGRCVGRSGTDLFGEPEG